MLRQSLEAKIFSKRCMETQTHIPCMMGTQDTNLLRERKKQPIAGHMSCGLLLRRRSNFLRSMTIKRSISNGSDTYQGMETTAIIGSVMQTLHRDKKLPFLSTLKIYLSEGIQEKYHQYMHIPYCDDY